MRRYFGLLFLVLTLIQIFGSIFGYEVHWQLKSSEMIRAGGHAFSAQLPSKPTGHSALDRFFITVPDTNEAPGRSTLSIYENGNSLERSHSIHETIRTKGLGRYSFWRNHVLFSSTDNTNPKYNKRMYLVKYRVYPNTYLVAILTPMFAFLFYHLILTTYVERVHQALRAYAKRHTGLPHAINFLSNFKRAHQEKYIDTKNNASAIKFSLLYFTFCLVITYLLASFYLFPKNYQPSMLHSVVTKIPYMKKYGKKYNLVFIGDSRTYCAFHPDLIDARMKNLDVHSINVSQFSHWLPTQYPMVKDLIPTLAPNATVVFSVGHGNFLAPNIINTIYPIDLILAARYIKMGYPAQMLWKNVSHFNPVLHFLSIRETLKANIKGKFKHVVGVVNLSKKHKKFAKEFSATPLIGSPNHAITTSTVFNERKKAYFERLAQEYIESVEGNPNIITTNIDRDEKGIVTSVTSYRAGGSYYRVELNHKFFVKKRQEFQEKLNMPFADHRVNAIISDQKNYVGVEPYLVKTFEAILSEFEQSGVKLVVSEIQEAPHYYGHPRIRAYWKKFMLERIKPMVEAHGFVYIEPDFKKLTDDDYFDYNHMNSQGSKKFTNIFSRTIQKHLKSKVKR